jgi:hypothetical protein
MKSDTFIRVAQLSELNGDGPFALSANEADIVLLKSRGSASPMAFEGRRRSMNKKDGAKGHRWSTTLVF